MNMKFFLSFTLLQNPTFSLALCCANADVKWHTCPQKLKCWLSVEKTLGFLGDASLTTSCRGEVMHCSFIYWTLEFNQPFVYDCKFSNVGVSLQLHSQSVGIFSCIPRYWSFFCDVQDYIKERRGCQHSSTHKNTFSTWSSDKTTIGTMKHNDTIVKLAEPTDCAHPIVIILQDESIRICLDPRKLNEAIRREHYRIPTQEKHVQQTEWLQPIFPLFYASKAFWHMVVDESSSFICTFATPWGRYRFLRLPFGLSTISQLFQWAMEDIFREHDDIRP